MAVMVPRFAGLRLPVRLPASSKSAFEPLRALERASVTESAFWFAEFLARDSAPTSMQSPIAVVDDERPLRVIRAVRVVEVDDDTL